MCEEKSSKRIRLKKIEIQKPKWDEGVSVRGGGCRSQVSGRPGETEDCWPSFEAGSQCRCDKQTNQTIVSSLVKTHDNRCRTNRGNCESSLGAWSARGAHIVGGIFTTFLFLSCPPGHLVKPVFKSVGLFSFSNNLKSICLKPNISRWPFSSQSTKSSKWFSQGVSSTEIGSLWVAPSDQSLSL